MNRLIRQIAFLLVFASLGLVSSHASSYSLAGANAYVSAKNWNGLLQYCRGWTQAEPNNPMGWYYMAQTLGAEMNQPQNALPAFQRAASLKSPWPEVWNALGHVYAQLGRYDESADSFHRAAQQNPQRMNYWTNLAGAYSDSNKWDLAGKALTDGQQNAAAQASYAEWYNLGLAFDHLREFQKAVYAYQQCLRMNARVGEAWNNLGVIMQANGNSTAALNDYRQSGALGDSLGGQNYQALQNGIRQAQSAAARRGGAPSPMAVQAAIAAEKAGAYSANHPEASWSESMDLANRH